MTILPLDAFLVVRTSLHYLAALVQKEKCLEREREREQSHGLLFKDRGMQGATICVRKKNCEMRVKKAMAHTSEAKEKKN